MNRIGTAVLLLAVVAGGAVAQQPPGKTEQALSKEQRQKIADITTQAQQQIRVYQAEIDILEAQLRRLLLSPDADIKEVEKLLRTGLEWELKIRVTEIRRELEIRRLIGDRKWAQYVRLRKERELAARQKSAQQQSPASRQSVRASDRLKERLNQEADRLATQILQIDFSDREAARKRLKALIYQVLLRQAGLRKATRDRGKQ